MALQEMLGIRWIRLRRILAVALLGVPLYWRF
jgi:hypothetical protein